MPASKIIYGIVFGVLALVVPWPIGGNLAFCRFWLLVAALVTIAWAIWEQSQARTIKKLPMVWIALLVGGIFILFQSLSVSSFLGSEIPITTNERFAASGLESVDLNVIDVPPVKAISVYPAATREKLVDLILACLVFFSATVLLSTRRSIEIALSGLALSGVLITFFGLVQNLSWSGKLFWQYELLSGGFVFSSFVNKNNAAGFLLITFGAAIFFVGRQIISWSRSNQPSGLIIASEDDWEAREYERQGLVSKFLKFVSKIEPRHLYATAASVVIFAGIIASLSRGGMLALGCGVVCCLTMLARKNRLLVAGLTLLLIAGAIGFVYFGEVSQSVVEKLESFSNLPDAGASRLQHWNDALPFAWNNSIVFGCGAGTYRYVTSSMQSFFFERAFAHAENVFLETLVEMGIVGSCILVFGLVLAFRSAIRIYRRREQFDQALGVAGITTLICVSVASVLDFGIYQPANFVVMALFMGAVVGCDYAGTEDTRERGQAGERSFGSMLVFACLVFAIVSGAWACYESYAIESRKFARRKISIINHEQNPQSVLASARSLESIKRNLETAIAIRPDDSEAHYQLGNFHVTRFRTAWSQALDESFEQEIAQIKEQYPNAEIEEVAPETIWQSTSLSFLHREIRLAERIRESDALLMKNDERVQAHLPSALKHYQDAERLCPRLYKTQFRLAQLSGPFGEDLDEKSSIQKTLQRNFWSSQVLYDCGLLALSSGDQETAIELWARCLKNPYSRSFERPIVEFSLELPGKQLFERVLPQNPENLIRVARNYFSTPELKLHKKYLLIHTERVIQQSNLPDRERFYYQAEAERLGEKFELAAESYARALKLEPERTLWRFEYAKCLHRIERYDEAIVQLKKCELENSRIRPSIKNLLNQIRRDRNRKSFDRSIGQPTSSTTPTD